MQSLPHKLLPFFWHFIKKQPVAFAVFFAAPCVQILEVTVIPYSLKLIIDATEQNIDNREAIFEIITPALWLIGIAWCTLVASTRLQNWWQGYIIPRFESDIRMSVMSYLANHSHQYFSDKLSGKLAAKINDLPKSLESIRMILCWNIITTSSVALASLVIIYYIKPIFAFILLVWIIVHCIISYYFSPFINKASKNNAKDRSTLNGKIVDTISNITSVKLFARKTYELSYIAKSQDKECKSNKHLIIMLNIFRLMMEIPAMLMLAFTIYFLVVNWRDDNISSGDFVFIFNVSFSIMDNLWHLGHATSDLFKEIGIAKQALSIIHAPHDICDKEDAYKLVVPKGKIEFQNVTFNYKKNDNIFTNESIVIEAGQKVGLVGFSGSGKTTFVNLILRFFDLSAGTIKIDDQSIAEVTQDSLRQNITVIPQDTSLFHRSLFENIRYGNIEASDDEIYEASKNAHCHEFIAPLPEGYESLVGERGIKLSGGQRQRIAIARALLKKAPILILDEATSALDSLTEKYIQESLQTLMQGKTTIIIAHRLSTLSAMDRILVFDKGHIIEDGTHDQLIGQNSRYKKLWKMQAGGFLPDKENEKI